VLLALTLHPGNILAWIIVGLLAGALAGRIVEGRGYGCLMDILLGLVGAFIGGQVVDPFFKGSAGFVGTLAVALIGALILIFAVRILRKIV
jgi:uncharacterized membrane protein YeaQ/YmgE (transglycosylase-associated protein family)